jgi:hypothetical protein
MGVMQEQGCLGCVTLPSFDLAAGDLVMRWMRLPLLEISRKE